MRTTRLYTLLALLLMAGGATMQAQNKDDPWPHYIEEYPLWIDSVTVQPNGFVMDAIGNVEISTPEGLAWLISAANGLNGCEPDNFDGRTAP